MYPYVPDVKIFEAERSSQLGVPARNESLSYICLSTLNGKTKRVGQAECSMLLQCRPMRGCIHFPPFGASYRVQSLDVAVENQKTSLRLLSPVPLLASERNIGFLTLISPLYLSCITRRSIGRASICMIQKCAICARCLPMLGLRLMCTRLVSNQTCSEGL